MTHGHDGAFIRKTASLTQKGIQQINKAMENQNPKEILEAVVRDCNRLLQKWEINECDELNNHDSIKSLFGTFLRKRAGYHTFSRLVRWGRPLFQTQSHRISKIVFADTDFNNWQSIADSLDYKALAEEFITAPEPEEISFESIKSIKF